MKFFLTQEQIPSLSAFSTALFILLAYSATIFVSLILFLTFEASKDLLTLQNFQPTSPKFIFKEGMQLG